MAAWFNEDQRRKLEEFYTSWDGVYYGKNEERFQELMQSTGLSRLQVRGWLRNRRNRGVYKGRIVHSVLQVRGLEWIYKNYAEYPTSHLKKKVGLAITMDPEQVNKWFETRRRRGTPKAALRSEHDQTPEWLSLLAALRRVVIEDSNGVNQKAFRDLKKKKKEENSFVSHYRLNNGAGPATSVPIMTKIAPTMTSYQSPNSFRDDFRYIGSTLATSFGSTSPPSPYASPIQPLTPPVTASASFSGYLGPASLANLAASTSPPPVTSPLPQTPILPHRSSFTTTLSPPQLPSSVALATSSPPLGMPTSHQQHHQPLFREISVPMLTQKAAVGTKGVSSSTPVLAVGPTNAEGASHKYSIDFLCS
eukprot:CAMPEP_0201521512 /NCGR_PEP_ID=MMETSP0161_2-20130828/14514_1 /ASSEMBLY_ACC=CAM_ASM_000251 /TAXON_ID=180227 /ORGANISM="Neoparamoeba aestuarina, Strain SoJaBio B1-5/56/2" /LENGTH=362 /DNA_ID=CAMNT_0047920157 /DNA_START=159 /DNA_END=1247 /DNA_ORIENTATION=-